MISKFFSFDFGLAYITTIGEKTQLKQTNILLKGILGKPKMTLLWHWMIIFKLSQNSNQGWHRANYWVTVQALPNYLTTQIKKPSYGNINNQNLYPQQLVASVSCRCQQVNNNCFLKGCALPERMANDFL